MLKNILINLLLVGLGASAWGSDQVLAPVSLERSERGIELSAELPRGFKRVEVRIESERNRPISKLTDLSDEEPRLEDLSPRSYDFLKNRVRSKKIKSWTTEMWFPIVDIELSEGMEGVGEFSEPKAAAYAINGISYDESGIFHDRIIVPANRLEYWENGFFIDSRKKQLDRFYLREELILSSNKLRYHFKPISKIWNGKVSVFGQSPSGDWVKLAEAEGPRSGTIPQPSFRDDSLSEDKLLRSLKASIDFTLRSQNETPHSPTYGGLNLFYDLDAHTYRTARWFWAWGPSIAFLLRAENVPGVASHYEGDALTAAADRMGACSLKFVCDDEEHYMYGQPRPIYTFRRQSKLGYGYNYSPADSGFLVGWGWLSLYEATGNKAYLEAADTYIASTNKFVDEWGLTPVPHTFKPETQKWGSNTNNESAFAMETWAEMYRLTKDSKYRESGKRYMEAFMQHHQTEEGLWNRRWLHNENRAVPPETVTRGQGWAVEALMAAYRLTSEQRYLDNARKMADQVISYQQPSGWWGFLFACEDELGISEKGTALWCYYLYRLYDNTKEEKYLAAARKALRWCLSNQYAGADVEAYGSLPGNTYHAAVYYRQWFNISCTYSTAFFGMAVMEELKVQEQEF